MATVISRSLHRGDVLSIPRTEVLQKVTQCERQNFSRTEAFDFEHELKKRNLEAKVLFDDLTGSNERPLVAYLVFARSKPGNIVLLHKICTHSAYRSQGIASKMLKDLIEELSTRGCSRVCLWVDQNNKVASNLYIQLGFEKISIVADYYGTGRTGLRMMMKLDQ